MKRPFPTPTPYIGPNNEVRLRLQDNTEFGVYINLVYPRLTGRFEVNHDGVMSDIQLREMEKRDTAVIASAFQAIGWHKHESQYQTYLKEQEEGKRAVLVAFVDDKFAGYGNVIWTSPYQPFQEQGIPEISDLNVLPNFRRKGVATAIVRSS